MNSGLISEIDLLINFATYISIIIGLIIGLRRAESNTNLNNAQFWLDIRSLFDEHKNIYQSLQKDQTWRNIDREVSDDEALAVIRYMGLFEHLYKMLENKLIDRDTFLDIYSYHILLIMNSPTIVTATLVHNGRWWLTFRRLAKELDFELPQRSDLHLDRTTVGYPAGWGRVDEKSISSDISLQVVDSNTTDIVENKHEIQIKD